MKGLRWGGFLSHMTSERWPSCRSFTNSCCQLVTARESSNPLTSQHKETDREPQREAGRRNSSYRALLSRPQPLIGRLQPSVISLICAAPVASPVWNPADFHFQLKPCLSCSSLQTQKLFSWFNAVSTFPDPSPPSSFNYKIKKINFLCY